MCDLEKEKMLRCWLNRRWQNQDLRGQNWWTLAKYGMYFHRKEYYFSGELLSNSEYFKVNCMGRGKVSKY